MKNKIESSVTLLVATGFHRLTREEELRNKLGDEIFDRAKIAVHDSQNPESNVQLGILPSGAPLIIDRRAVETDLLISEGFIEPHFFAGFSGSKSGSIISSGIFSGNASSILPHTRGISTFKSSVDAFAPTAAETGAEISTSI